MTHGYTLTDRTPDKFYREFKKLEKIHSSSKDGEQESESRPPDTQYLMDIYMSDESERGSKDILPSAAHREDVHTPRGDTNDEDRGEKQKGASDINDDDIKAGLGIERIIH